MKILTYQVEGYTDVYDPITEEVKQIPSYAGVRIKNPSAEDIEKAKEIAYNGEYHIDDDGQPEPDTTTTDDVLNALLGVM